MKKNRILSLLTVAVMLVAIALSLGISSFASEESTAVESKGEIDVWLIGGQSNAVGYGTDMPADAANDPRYYVGFDNTLYYGIHEQFKWNSPEFEPLKVGKGQQVQRQSQGAETGIAKVVDGTGKMNAVIKCAVGATSLYPHLTANISTQVGTWTSPSYIARANMDKNDPNYAALGTFVDINGATQDIPDVDLTKTITNGNADNQGKVIAGNMYDMFIRTMTEGVKQLKEQGYTPKIRGMWWMQGEAECGNTTQAWLYDELLTCLIEDIRRDVAAISGDASVSDAENPMPFLAGNIIWNLDNAANAPKYMYQVNNAQAMVKAAMKNVSYLDRDVTTALPFFGQQDNWHYNTATQEYFGEQLVKYVLDVNGQKLVFANGLGFTFEGGGTIKSGSEVTVTLKAKENYRIDSVTCGPNTVTLDENGSYTFTVTEDTYFDVETTYIGAIAENPYDTITAEYGDTHYYPFALFKNGSFVKGYAAWRTAMMAIPTGESSDEYVILLRRDYTTAGIDGPGAARIANIGAKVTLDLGGYEMTRHGFAYIFDIYHTSKNTYETNVTIKNGAIINPSDSPLIGLNYSTGSSYANARTYNFTFEEVEIINQAQARSIPLISACWEDGNADAYAGIHANITLNGCTVDMGNADNGILAGLTNDAKKTNTVCTLTVNGGNIIAKGAYSLAQADTLDSVTVGEYNGSYPKVTLPSSVAPSSETYKNANGEFCGTVAGTGVTDGENTVYTFAPDSLVTPYGTIGADFADANAYPFAIFNANGFVTAAANFNLAIDSARKNMKDKESLIYLRRNYYNTSADGTSGLLTYVNGTVKIDLNGKTLGRNGKTLFDVYIDGKGSSGYVTNIVVMNGTLSSKDGGIIIAMDYNGSASSQVATSVKKYNMSFIDVTFKSEVPLSGGRALALDIWDNTKPVAYKTQCVFDYYGCTFDMTNANGKHPFRMSDRANRNPSMDVAVNVYGGEFINMGSSWMAYMDAGDSTNFGKYEGKYPTLTTAAGVDIRDINSNFGALGAVPSGSRARIIKVSSDSSWNYYRIGLQEATPYGNINAKYDDTSEYPMAFFSYDTETKTYTFLKVGKFGNIRDFYSNTEEKYIVAYLRADHTINLNTDPTHIKGTLILDLGGKTLTRDATHMFDVIGSNNYRDFVSNTVVKNGTVLSKTSFAIGINNSAITTANKTWNLTFEGVTFKYAAGNTTSQGAFFNCWKSTNANEGFGYVININFNDCTYDFTNAPKNAYMFDFTGSDSTQETDVTAYFNGGKVIAPTMATNWKLFVFNAAQDSAYFGETAPQVQIAIGGTQPTDVNTVTTSDKSYAYIAVETTADYKLYNLSVFESEEDTPYGPITGLTSVTASMADYPLALFVPNGDSWTYVGVYKTWAEAVNAAFANQGSVIYFRTNLNLTGSTPSLVGKQVTFTVDLNGKTFTKVASGYLFSNYLGATKTEVNITFKNGSLAHGPDSSWQPFFNFDYGTGHTVQDASFNYTFENVTFENNRKTYQNYFIFCPFESEAAYNTPNIKAVNAHIVYNGCTFKANGAYIFDCTQDGNARDNIDMTVEVNGGKFIDDEMITSAKLIRVNKAGDSVTFGKYNGSYPEFVYPKTMGYALHGVSFVENGIRYTLAPRETVNDNVIYAFTAPIETKYGSFDAEYDVSAYPYVVFKADKTFVGAYGELGAAINAAVINDNNGNFNILMRRDAPQNTGGGVGGFKGSITLDLGGYTINDENAQYIFDAWIWANATEQTMGTFTVKNGSIAKNGPDALFCVNYGDEVYANVTYKFIFENVKFTFYNKTNGLFVTWENGMGKATANQIADITFNNCIFDLANSEDGTVPFCLTMSGGTGTIFNVTVNGGTIIADKAITYNEIVVKDNNEYVVFGKNSEGKYTTLSIPKDAAAPDMNNVWTTADGIECVFVKVSENDGYVNYSLYPKAMVGYKIKTSVTLWSNFVYNIYIPKANVNSFTINGVAMNYEEVELDGVTYYHVAVNLPAGETLSDIKVCVKLNSGNTTVDANWTLNVLNYTKSILAGEYDNVTKTLMKDMLVYASAAHTYFENTEAVSAKLSEIATLLEGYAKEMPTGEAKQPTGTTYFKEVTVNLDKVPSFIFTLADGYTADDFTFKVGSRPATVIAGDGYVEIVMYAYMMLDDVTFTVKGTDVTESYNLYAYYDYAKTLNNANLTAIVEALMKYSVSAKAYRESVIN
ncbi:MAG: sialate O-acetylesterase [Ruminococcaceae bacterium]|nr:sialate O-acetylesterase [Oscillospiraceae bacterium]